MKNENKKELFHAQRLRRRISAIDVHLLAFHRFAVSFLFHLRMELESCYEISRVANFIRSHNFTKVALQFPDEQLKDSKEVVRVLHQELHAFSMESISLYVLADTTYGSCCVDEVAAAHVNADCVIHYGHTCLSQTSTLPALFVFGKALVSVSNCAENLLDYGSRSRKPVLILYGLEYAHAIPEIKKAVAVRSSSTGSFCVPELLYAEVRSSVMIPSEELKTNIRLGLFDNQRDNGITKETGLSFSAGGLSWILPEGHNMENYLLFWIGLDDSAFANVVLTFNTCEIVRYAANEECLVLDFSQQKKILKRRYYLVERAKDASMIGILVGTLGAAGYLHVIHKMNELITKAGKKSYTFVMGRPNPSKLANFPECDVFINVSCAQTTLLDSKEFLAPVITPFEAMLALDRGRQWTGAYVMDFKDLIGSTPLEKGEGSGEARYSFLQGGYIEDLDLQDGHGTETSGVVALLNDTEKALRIRDGDSLPISTRMAKSGAEYFASRSYHGLEINNNNALPQEFLTGRKGKASGYDDEKTEP